MADIYAEYDSQTLKKLQALELEILKDVDKICEANHLVYFCLYGTGIGVVRHKGFIPWDDDIDIGLLRCDYDRLLRLVREQLPDKYYVLNTETDPDYPLMTTRICLQGTRFQEECFKDLACKFGIFLDVYCFDYIPEDDRQMKRLARRLWLKSKLMILAAIGDPVIYFNGWKGQMVKIGCNLCHSVFRILGLHPSEFYNSIRKDLLKTKELTSRVAFQFDTNMYSSVISVADLLPVEKKPFENLMVCCPKNLEKHLETYYGDYITLPPLEKRHNHPPYKLDFGKY